MDPSPPNHPLPPNPRLDPSLYDEEESTSVPSTALPTGFKPLESYESLLPPPSASSNPSYIPWILTAWIAALFIILCQCAFFLTHLERELLPSLQLESPEWAKVAVEAPPPGVAPVIIHSPDSVCTEPYIFAVRTSADDSESRHQLRHLYGATLGVDGRLIFPVGRVRGAKWDTLDLNVYTEARRFDDMIIADFDEQSSSSIRHGDHMLTALNYFLNSCVNGTLILFVDGDQIINPPALLLRFTEMTVEGYFDHNGIEVDIFKEHLMAGRYQTESSEPWYTPRMMGDDRSDDDDDHQHHQRHSHKGGSLYKLRASSREKLEPSTTMPGVNLLGGVLDGSFFFLNKRLAKRLLEQRLRFPQFESDDLGILVTEVLHKTLTSFVNVGDMYVDLLQTADAIDCLKWWWGPRNLTTTMQDDLQKHFEYCINESA